MKSRLQYNQERIIEAALKTLRDEGYILQHSIRDINILLNKSYNKEIELVDVEVSNNNTLADARFEESYSQ